MKILQFCRGQKKIRLPSSRKLGKNLPLRYSRKDRQSPLLASGPAGLLGCQANFGEQNPSETRNTNLISLDVAPKL